MSKGSDDKRPARPSDDAARAAEDRLDSVAMERFKAGDLKAFEGLLHRHKGGVYNFCLRMLGDPIAAEDAMQEVFLRVVKGRATWERSAKFTTWLYRIARNHCIDALRRRKHRRTASLDQPLDRDDEGGLTVGDRVEDPDAVPPDRGADAERARRPILEAIASLPDDQREVFLMREHAGMPFKEIAEVVGAPENTVKSRMRYALEHLRKRLSAAGLGPEAP